MLEDIVSSVISDLIVIVITKVVATMIKNNKKRKEVTKNNAGALQKVNSQEKPAKQRLITIVKVR